jgi:hypothetical protein
VGICETKDDMIELAEFPIGRLCSSMVLLYIWYDQTGERPTGRLLAARRADRRGGTHVRKPTHS